MRSRLFWGFKTGPSPVNRRKSGSRRVNRSGYASFRPDKADFEGKKFLTTLDIWLGGQVELDKLDVPLSIHMKSSGEMERFIDRHEKKREHQDGNE